MSPANEVRTTAKSFEIIDALYKNDGATLLALTETLEMPKSTIHRHLATLQKHGYVQVEDDEYHVGFRFLELGEYTRNRKEAYRLAEQPVNTLAEETGERAQFVVEEQGEGIYLYVETGQHAVRTGVSVGHRVPLHSTSAGKVILSQLPPDRVDEILDDQELPALTEETITDPEELKSQLSEIRERGYAFNREENIKGLRAVSGPVTDENDEFIGVLSVSGPSHRMKGEWFRSELPDLVLGTANEFELRIAYA
jgi:DNA-binding IclR family transcriptional regulator